MKKGGARLGKIKGENGEIEDLSEEENEEAEQEQEQIADNSLPFLSMLTQALGGENISNQEDMDGLTQYSDESDMITNSILFSKSRYPITNRNRPIHGSDANPSEFDQIGVNHILDTDIGTLKKIL